MSKTYTLRSGILAISMLAASGFVAAADNAANSPPPHKQGHHRNFDPVARTQRNLDNLARKLSLKEEQKAAWQVYADSSISRTKERAASMQQLRSHHGEARREADTATRLDEMSQTMRVRADELHKVAQDTRALQATLSPEQKTIFDLYWKAQFQRGMMHHRRAA
jgi:Spy/CpxP family protein refolding chaperone